MLLLSLSRAYDVKKAEGSEKSANCALRYQIEQFEEVPDPSLYILSKYVPAKPDVSAAVRTNVTPLVD